MRALWRRAVFALVAGLLAAAPTLAEVRVVVQGGEYRGFIMLVMWGDDDDPTPFPWREYLLHFDLAFLLNRYGDDQGDGPAQMGATGIDPTTGFPVVAWADAEYGGLQHDIAISEWTGTGWSRPITLFTTIEDDHDPALIVDSSGTRHIVWWRPKLGAPDVQEIIYVRQSINGDPASQSRAQIVDAGVRPSVSVWRGDVHVAYQRLLNQTAQIIVATLTPGDWRRQTLAQTDYRGPRGDGDIDVKIHSSLADHWADWINGEGVLGFSVFDAASGAWSAPQYEPYSWNSGGGEFFAREGARQRIRQRISGRTGGSETPGQP